MKEQLENNNSTDEASSLEVQQKYSDGSKTDFDCNSSPACNKKRPVGKREKRVRKKPCKPIIEEQKQREDVVDFTQHSRYLLADSEMTREIGTICKGYGTCASHERKQKAELSATENSGQEIEYDEYGVQKNKQDSQSHNNNGYTGGIKRS